MSQTKPVRTRQVFYLPGYDPVPARHYREIYRREGAAQAAISGYQLEMQAKADKSRYAWQVLAKIEGGETRTDIEFLEWNDIVVASMQSGILASYWLLLRTLWLYLRSGTLLSLLRLRPAPMIAAFYPVLIMFGQLGVALFAAGLPIWAGVVFGLPWLGWALGIGAFAGVLLAFKRNDNRIYAYYLLYVYAFSAWHTGGYPPILRTRLEEFKARIAKALTEDNDEVLIVGHSVGAHLGVELLAEMEREGMITGNTPLSLLTLGHVVPMISYLPEARMLRRNLHDLGQSSRVYWADFTAPGDGGCFALCDPVAVSGGGDGPKVLSAAFSKTLSPGRFKAQKNAFFKQHFQYLHAFDRPGIYDYFAITAGPKTLRARYGDQPHSPSRRTKCYSKHTDMADV
ncbi:MAG: hypothetical protein L3J37_08620 [Rhodobacteraceae bacterium]|nr:hypothetical protein [Paracoccaceae bacterium]